MVIYFYSKNDSYGCFSNFSPHRIYLNQKCWPTVEHYFQAQKFTNSEYVEKIRRAHTPKQASILGKSREYKIRHDWEKIKDETMYKGVFEKFETHKNLKTILVTTYPEEIIESAPGDYYWGCGADGSGKNMLGKILMNIRENYITKEV